MFQYMAKSFISVIDQTLSEIDAWNSEVSLAWEQLFQWITFGLGKGMCKSIIGLVPTTKITDGCFLIELLKDHADTVYKTYGLYIFVHFIKNRSQG